jgi:putative thioredoxin
MADVTDATFQVQVIERSAAVPVVVDLWADWCQPCKTLGPVIEKVIAETNGAVELAKVDIEANPQVAQAFQAQSIPAVHAIVDGKVADSFLGAQPEATVRAFVQKLIQTPEQATVAQLVAQGDEASLRAAIEVISDDPAAVLALATLLVERSNEGDAEEAEQLLERIPESAETRHVAALARTGGRPEGGDAAVEAELDHLLTQVKSDDDARVRFVDLLEVLSDDESRTAWRRKLSASLF